MEDKQYSRQPISLRPYRQEDNPVIRGETVTTRIIGGKHKERRLTFLSHRVTSTHRLRKPEKILALLRKKKNKKSLQQE